MASIKLNKGIREKIVNLLLEHRFAEDQQTLENDKEGLAEKAYNILYTKSERERMNSLPEGWLDTTDGMRICLPVGYNNKWYFFAKDAEGKRPPKRITQSKSYQLKLKANDKFAIEYQDYLDRIEDLDEKRKRTKAEATALLESVTTVNRAIEIWPEAETFIKQGVGVVKQKTNAPLPVIMREQLNENLNLPPE